MPNLHSIRLDYANLLADMGKNKEAIEEFNVYIKHYPTDARAYKNLAIVQKRMNNIDLAIANYEKAISLNLDDVNVRKDLASCYHIKKDYIWYILMPKKIIKDTFKCLLFYLSFIYIFF